MEQYIGCDSHRRYSVFVVMDEKGRATAPMRVEHNRSEVRDFLKRLPAGSNVVDRVDRRMVLAGRRIGSSRVDAASGACLRRQAANDGSQQDGSAGCSRTCDGTADGHAAEHLDPTRRVA
jgi:hypothetical protein